MDAKYLPLLEQLRTPYQVPWLQVAPSFIAGQYDSHAVDGAFVFRHEGRFYMSFIGFDGTGYRTGLAVSGDLMHWRKEGMIIDRGGPGSQTEFNAAMIWILRDNDLYGSGELLPVDGRYIGTYHAYPAAGYEAGPASIGICSSRDLRRWDLAPFSLQAADGGEWERGGLYKSCLLRHENLYYMFYNAKNSSHSPWHEQIGVVTSTDLVHWERYAANPVLPVGPAGSWDERFASDPYILRIGSTWVMFYYGLAADGHARDGVAFSDDLLHWDKAPGPILDVGAPGSLDSQYAHKPAVIYNKGVLYHYYCAVSPALEPQHGTVANRELRGIGLRTSQRVSV
ncbi:MAG: glycoside hydrolase family protein [Anaerolineae bacterium]